MASIRRLTAIGEACRKDKEEIVKYYKKVCIDWSLGSSGY